MNNSYKHINHIKVYSVSLLSDGYCKTPLSSSSINYFRYEAYVLVGLESGVGEPVFYHKDLLVGVVGGE